MRVPLLNIIVPFIITILVVEYEIMEPRILFYVFILIELIRIKLIKKKIQKIIILFINLVLISNFLLKDEVKQNKNSIQLPKREIALKINFSL